VIKPRLSGPFGCIVAAVDVDGSYPIEIVPEGYPIHLVLDLAYQ
jgi:hypothetical protein